MLGDLKGVAHLLRRGAPVSAVPSSIPLAHLREHRQAFLGDATQLTDPLTPPLAAAGVGAGSAEEAAVNADLRQDLVGRCLRPDGVNGGEQQRRFSFHP